MTYSRSWRLFRRMQGACLSTAVLIYAAGVIQAWRVLPGTSALKLQRTLMFPGLFLAADCVAGADGPAGARLHRETPLAQLPHRLRPDRDLGARRHRRPAGRGGVHLLVDPRRRARRQISGQRLFRLRGRASACSSLRCCSSGASNATPCCGPRSRSGDKIFLPPHQGERGHEL